MSRPLFFFLFYVIVQKRSVIIPKKNEKTMKKMLHKSKGAKKNIEKGQKATKKKRKWSIQISAKGTKCL